MLADIELAQTLQAAPGEEEKVEEVPHPLDRDYQLLKCQLQLLDPGESEYKAIQTYLEQTGNGYRRPDLQHVWKVNREGRETGSRPTPNWAIGGCCGMAPTWPWWLPY